MGGLVVRSISAWQRRTARTRGIRTPLTGAITFVQRFGGLVNLNVHYHLVVPDGVFVEDGDSLTFVLLPVPTSAHVHAILDRIMRRIVRRLANEAIDDLDEAPALDVFAQVQAEAATTWRSPPAIASTSIRGSERLRAWCDGFSLHAAVVIADHDRDALERLRRYGARPAFAQGRLAWTADSRISYELKRPWPDGRTHLVLEPVAFLRRLVGIIPPPRRHLVRYAGVFGPASKHRAKLRALILLTQSRSISRFLISTPFLPRPVGALVVMIKMRVLDDGEKRFQVYGRARIREKSVKIYVGTFASQRDAEAADEDHRVTQRGIKGGICRRPSTPSGPWETRSMPGSARSLTSARTTSTRAA